MAVIALAATLDVSGVFAAPAPPAAAAKRIQLNAHDQPVRDVLLRIGELAHLNITVADDVRGNVNLTLHDATADEAVHAVCTQLALRCVRDGRTVAVYAQSSVVVPLAIVRAGRAAQMVRQLFPRLAVRVDPAANALVLAGAQSDIQAARAVIAGLDVRDATKPATESITLRTQPAQTVADRLRAIYPAARITVLSRATMLVSATPPDLAQIKTLVAGIDAPTPPPVSQPVSSDAVRVSQRRPQDVARAVTAQIPRVRTAVSGTTVTLTGSPDDVARAKALIAQLDLPPYGMRYVQIYRIHNVDAKSVADLIRSSFPSVTVTVDAGLNAISVTANAGEHQRIGDGIAAIDGTAANGQNPAGPGGGGGAPSSHEVIQLKSIVPGGTGAAGASTTPQDIGAAVQAALQGSFPDLRVTVPNGTQQLILTGSPQAIRAGRELIAELDVVPQSVVLDTEILELDENSSRNLGLQLGNSGAISTTFTELQPAPDANGNAGRLIGLQPFTRSPISFSATLNLLISNGKARVLADPRITTLSGRTATIRAGDTLSILTTTGGGAGTVPTQQLQSFQTGVTLDITPIITNNGELTVALHPVVNSLTGLVNGIPEISTRDTQTTVHLRDNETLVIGGLIQESSQRTESRIPLLGSLPLIGRVFRNDNTTSTRNELIIVVTPHILNGNMTSTIPNAAAPPGMLIPTPRPLPTVPPNTGFPTASPTLQQRPVQRQAATPPPPAGTPVPQPPPAATSAPTPQSTPTALSQANVYVYGSPPPNTYAAPGDAPQIFYASLSPTVVAPNTTVRVSAITTTNVQRLTIGTGNTNIALARIGTGTWQGVFAANALGLAPTATSIQLSLIASRNDGQSATIPIPVSLIH
ncbi:MAG: ral secretion pathway protein [Candidatus Eremiobacteraeota bacterium]|jgi:type II secretory pathway component GspD/PulD (secretin)|nr:ral secretion pathway protein [Candidatus Eremiobacteraeota bacterium]